MEEELVKIYCPVISLEEEKNIFEDHSDDYDALSNEKIFENEEIADDQ